MPILNNWGGAGSNFKSNNAYNDFKPFGIGPSETTNIKLRGGGHGEVINPALGFMGAVGAGYLYENSEKAREVVDGSIGAVSDGIGAVSDFVKKFVRSVTGVRSDVDTSKDNSAPKTNEPNNIPPASGPNLLSVLKENNQNLVGAIYSLSSVLISVSMAEANRHKVQLPNKSNEKVDEKLSVLQILSSSLNKIVAQQDILLKAVSRPLDVRVPEKSLNVSTTLTEPIKGVIDFKNIDVFRKIQLEMAKNINNVISALQNLDRNVKVENLNSINVNPSLNIDKPVDVNLPEIYMQLAQISKQVRDLQKESLEYKKTAVEVFDMDGKRITKVAPRELLNTAAATRARGDTDENNLNVDDFSFLDDFDIEKILIFRKFQI